MEDARPLVQRLFEFLEAYNQKRNPVVRDVSRYENVWWWDDVPITESIYVAPFEDAIEDDEPPEHSHDANNQSALLTVRRASVPAAPSPPEGLAQWLQPGWDDPRRPASWTTELDDPEQGRLVLGDELVQRLETWSVERDVWANQVKPEFMTLQLFQWLWDVHSTLEREGERYELVLGDGILVWDTQGQPTTHPLLIQRLQIDFDATVPSFTITEADRPTELYSSILRVIGADPGVVNRLMERVDREKPHPLGLSLTDEFLRQAAGELHPQGQFDGFAAPPVPKDAPRIVRAPVLFLRSRALGYEAAIQAIKEHLEDGAEIPDSLQTLVGVHSSLGGDVEAVDPFEQGDEAEDVLLTKEANREQLEIARRLVRYGAVLVQGPPGTGKTHTIANLIGHLLANGKRVLVTSHTTKALRVLRQQVVSELQPLCVSVLEGDSASNAQLADAVGEISQRLSSSSEDQLMREAEEIRASRTGTLEAIADARAQLLELVNGEYSTIVLNGTQYSPIEAARVVNAGLLHHDWIPGEISTDNPFPLSGAELQHLYSLNSVLTEEDLRDIRERIPDPALLPTPAAFETKDQLWNRLLLTSDFRRDLWSTTSRAAGDLDNFSTDLQAAFGDLDDVPNWYLFAMDASLTSDEEGVPWLLLRDALARLVRDLRDSRLVSQTHATVVPENISGVDIPSVLGSIADRLRAGKSLPRFLMPKEWKLLLRNVSVLGKPPASLEDFEALCTFVAPRESFQELIPRWSSLMAPLGEPLPGLGSRSDEVALESQLKLLEEALDERPAMIREALQEADAIGLAMTTLLPETSSNPGGLWAQVATTIREQLPDIISAERSRLLVAEMEQDDAILLQQLSEFAGYADEKRPVGQLTRAIRTKDPKDFAEAYERVRSLFDKRSAAAEREDLLSRLSPLAHEWAEAIRLRRGSHGHEEPPGDPLAAWQWKQLAQILDFRSRGRVEDIIGHIGTLRDRLRTQTTLLIDRLAWSAQARNTNPSARQALGGYVELIKKIGKGTGRRAPRLRESARQQMSMASAAVPVWIAPLSRVAEAFDPRTQKFDVVIIDEASQSDVLGLISWYLGKNVVVVGDDQQVTPDAVGDRIDDMTAMIDTFLGGIPNRELYDGQASIYQLAATAFRGVVRLREHFRCLPEIISFSDALCYGDILPLRDPSTARVTPAVISYRVQVTPSRDRDVNEPEARTIASLLAACMEQREYAGMTFGVISLLGNKQSARIDQIIRNVLSPNEYQDRRLLCGTPPNFQGDERDVVFLSLVDLPPENPPLPRRGDPGERFKKRFNVATSRAKDQLWIVHSLDHQSDLQVDDLRWRLLDWATDPSALTQRKEHAIRKAESPLESEVLKRLVNAGYLVEPQYNVGAYRIDIVVTGKESSRLAIECDGDQYHSTSEQVRSDLDRQALLERMGWRFCRVRGSEFYRDPDSAMSRIFSALENAGVTPDDSAGAQQSVPINNELMQRVKTRASELRQEWWPDPDNASSRTPTPAKPQMNRDERKEDSVGAGAVQPRWSVGPELSGLTDDESLPDSSTTVDNADDDLEEGQSQSPEEMTSEIDLKAILSADDAVEYFRNRGFRVVDNRGKGGALWIYAPHDLVETEMAQLARGGIRFSFSRSRGGWWTSAPS